MNRQQRREREKAQKLATKFLAKACVECDLVGTDVYQAARQEDLEAFKAAFKELPVPEGVRLLKNLKAKWTSNNAMQSFLLRELDKESQG